MPGVLDNDWPLEGQQRQRQGGIMEMGVLRVSKEVRVMKGVQGHIHVLGGKGRIHVYMKR